MWVFFSFFWGGGREGGVLNLSTVLIFSGGFGVRISPTMGKGGLGGKRKEKGAHSPHMRH